TTIFVSDKFTTSAVTSSSNMFGSCTSLVGAIKYDPNKTDANYANTNDGYFTLEGTVAKPKGAYVVYTDADKTLTFKYGEIPESTETVIVYDIPNTNTDPGWLTNKESIQKVVFDETFKGARPQSCYSWFWNCTSLTTISGIENLNTEEVTNMSYMFQNCPLLTSLDLSGFNTTKVEKMSCMFFGCTNLTTIFVSDKFTTSAVTQSNNMFTNCSNLVGAINYNYKIIDKTGANYATGYFTYAIKTAADLASFAECVNTEGNEGGAAALFNDITMTAEDNFSPITSNYTGTFDGRGHTISGLNFNAATPALFSQNSGTIKNLGVVNVTIAEGCNGGICQTNSGTINSCFFTGTTEGTTSPGGTICQTNNGTITNCYYLADSEIDEIEGTTAMTTAQFKSGEVCYLLNGSSPYGEWGQQLGVNDYPVLGSSYKLITTAYKKEDDTYWATFSDLTTDVTLSVSSTRTLKVYNATVSAGTMTLAKRDDNQVAKGEGVLLKTDGKYVNVKANDIPDWLTKWDYMDNNLVATPETADPVGGDVNYKLYRLTYNTTQNKDNLGFYLGVATVNNTTYYDGFYVNATPGKAYLKVQASEAKVEPFGASIRGFAFPGDDGETTGIECITVTDEGLHSNGNAEGIFDLQGRKVSKPTKGVYIKNNRVVFKLKN
ncbi:MAG: BspA family leucine-rich repeat surface protein, partial [Prevotella sp.]